MLILFRAFWNILWTFGIFHYHLVHFFLFWYQFQEKSGNPGQSICREAASEPQQQFFLNVI
jgi:hypothetical protein